LPGAGASSQSVGGRSSDGEFRFLSSALPAVGSAVIEAADLSEALKIVCLTPCAVAHGVLEVWPLEEAQMREKRY
jgi:hypothetical protein